jgi:hypothetical protein
MQAPLHKFGRYRLVLALSPESLDVVLAQYVAAAVAIAHVLQELLKYSLIAKQACTLCRSLRHS